MHRSARDTTQAKGDETTFVINYGFFFVYIDILFQSVTISINGRMQFDTSRRLNVFSTDLWTTRAGNIFHRSIGSSSILTSISTLVANSNGTFYNGFVATNAFIATWDQAAHYTSTITGNATFQVILVTDRNMSFVMYNYGRLDFPRLGNSVSVVTGLYRVEDSF